MKVFLKTLLKVLPKRPGQVTTVPLPRPEREPIEPGENSPIRPAVLLNAIQKVIVEGSDAVVMSESGNSLAWEIMRCDLRNRVVIGSALVLGLWAISLRGLWVQP